MDRIGFISKANDRGVMFLKFDPEGKRWIIMPTVKALDEISEGKSSLERI